MLNPLVTSIIALLFVHNTISYTLQDVIRLKTNKYCNTLSLSSSSSPTNSANDDSKLQEFLSGEYSKTWRGTKTMLERRGETPSPNHNAIDVIRILLKALKSNDYPQLDHGACVLLEFKSPTGPLAVFSNPAELGSYFRKNYPNLVDFKEAKLSGNLIDIKPTGTSEGVTIESVKQLVEIYTYDDIKGENYDLFLSKIDGLWLVDAIVKV